MAEPMQLDTIQSTAKLQRVAAHTHIKGLGLNEEDGSAIKIGGGLVGNELFFCVCFVFYVISYYFQAKLLLGKQLELL